MNRGMPHPMLMVIFGAGASYDSFATHPAEKKMYPEDRPPLAVELFDNRPAFAKVLREFADCQSIVSDLRHRDPKHSVEQVLERLQSQNANDPIGQMEMAAVRYYLQKIIRDCEARWEERHSGVTNYRALLRLKRKRPSQRASCMISRMGFMAHPRWKCESK